uniref:Acyltransferase 3 domain-containing protein n=1 Tax=Alexandrium andersonii TaxID=327968 RepID=A0A6U6I1X9_9DINO
MSACFDYFGMTPFLIFPTGLTEFTHSVAFFTAGVLAGRNGWLEEEGTWLTANFWKLLLLTLTLLAAAFVDRAQRRAQSAFSLMVLQGYWPVLGACFHLEWFRRDHSSGGPVQEFLASAAYGVYLIHPLTLTLAAWSYTVVLRRAGHLVVAYAPPHDDPSSLRFVVQSDSGLLVWGGWVYCSVISLITSWPLAWAVKQLPGFRRVL